MEIHRCMKCMREYPSGERECSACGNLHGQEEQPSFALPCGTILKGKYLIGCVMGQGGFGITYTGFDLLLNLKVAIKEYYPSYMASRDSRTGTVYWHSSAADKKQGCDNFLKEARKMARLDNIPGVVRVRDILMEYDTAYIVMDFVEGETLKSRLKKQGPMDFDETVRMLTPIIKALEEVHGHGIIHRDISPDNIMLTPEGGVRLLDLGAAKEVDLRSDGDRQSSQLIHKDGFSPPEQYLPKGHIGPWTDVYSLCASIYYCCTGKLIPSAMERLVGEEVQMSAIVSPKAIPILGKGLAIKTEDRYQNMTELYTVLKKDKVLLQENDDRIEEEVQRRLEEEKQKEEQQRLEEEARKASEKRREERKQEEERREQENQEQMEERRKAQADKKKKICIGIAALAGAVVVLLAGLALGRSGAGSKKETNEKTEIAQTETVETVEPVEETKIPEESEPLQESVSDQEAANSYGIGDTIRFGSYEQDGDSSNGAEDIEWIVLDKDEDGYLLLSKYGLDAVAYNDKLEDVTWETCSIRKWLNEDFYNTAFSSEEREKISLTKLSNKDNPKYGTDGGKDTEDKVYLLSIEEAEKYFTTDKKRQAEPTELAVQHGAYVDSDRSSCWWWLRSPGGTSHDAADVGTHGGVYQVGNGVGPDDDCVRPALWVNL